MYIHTYIFKPGFRKVFWTSLNSIHLESIIQVWGKLWRFIQEVEDFGISMMNPTSVNLFVQIKKSMSSQVFCIWNLVSSKVGLSWKKSSPWKTFWPSKTIPSNTIFTMNGESDLRFDLDVWQQGSIHENITSICFLKLRTSVIDMQRGWRPLWWLVLTWKYPCN